MKRNLALILCAGMIGFVWGHVDASALIGLAIVMPVLWHMAGSRWIGGAIALAYYTAGSRGLPFGAGIFFETSAPVWFGWALWLSAGLFNSALWVALWQRDPSRRAWCGLIALVLTAIPPVGVFGWNNPLTAAGILFPQFGFVGLLLLMGLVFAAMSRDLKLLIFSSIIAAVANCSAIAFPVIAPAGWAAQDTHFAKLKSASEDMMGEAERVMHVYGLARELGPGQVLVLPETVLPKLSSSKLFTNSILADVSSVLKEKGSAIVVGAESEASGKSLNNALLVLGDGSNKMLIQRVPVPIGMWRPWSNESVNSNLFGNGIGEIHGIRLAYSVCYEQLLVWPVLFSMVHSPEVLIGAANDWWAKDTSIPAIQQQSLNAWGRLFNIPVVQATNI